MRLTRSARARHSVAIALGILLLAAGAFAQQAGKKTLTFADLMKFRAVEKPVISDNGALVAYGLQPDRGDGEGIVQVVATGRQIKIPRGGAPVISKDARYVAMVVKPPLALVEKAGKDKPKPGMALVDATTGAVSTFENVERFAFSDDSRWLAWLVAVEEKPAPKGDEAARAAGNEKAGPPKKPAGTLELRDLAAATTREVPSVSTFAFDPASHFLAYAVAEPAGNGNGLFLRALDGRNAGTTLTAAAAEKAGYDNLAWSRDGARLAFSSVADKEKTSEPATIWLWQPGQQQATTAVGASHAPAGWMLPFKNDLRWSRDGSDLYFGFKPASPGTANGNGGKSEAVREFDPYDFDAMLSKAEVDVWHWNDPRIIPQQKMTWERDKDRTYRAVLHAAPAAPTLEAGKKGTAAARKSKAALRPVSFTPSVVVLADRSLSEVAIPDNPRVALGMADGPYLKETTWGERFRDVYVVDQQTGTRTQVTSRLRDQASLSPDGRYVAFYKDKQWWLYDVAARATRSATSGLAVNFFDEEHDTPEVPPSYGLGGWVEDGSAVLIYDRYDIWKVPTAGGTPINATAGAGRKGEITFRVVSLDPEQKGLPAGAPLLLTAYHNREKNWGFYGLSLARPGVEARVDERKLFTVVAKAKKADVLLYTREDYGEFPDVWASDLAFRAPKRLSDANPQLAEFAWGSAELVEYVSQDGVPLQGILIKPANYQPGKRYPVITYFYERQSQRLYEFNEPVVNHRPSFPIYAAAGYAIFLPDIVFTVGHPGQSMLKCLVPAVQKLVDMGVADPAALGLHGHSWGGYGTAYVVTQTNMFKAAVAGAPVSNMTSAYGGIRWESGLARQFQYEQSQSRIGGSLWEKRDLYLENSALFFADKVKTPLLIEHGDEDGAVPWYQGIEMYLALRRLGKDCIMLQYRGEPHHLKKYPNKLDYSIRMKEYFDHYLKGEPAAAWITEGIAYTGR